jgi:hypothetical protein
MLVGRILTETFETSLPESIGSAVYHRKLLFLLLYKRLKISKQVWVISRKRMFFGNATDRQKERKTETSERFERRKKIFIYLK